LPSIPFEYFLLSVNQVENVVSSHREYRLKVPTKLPSEALGDIFFSVSADVGRKPIYGQALRICGEYQRRLGYHEVQRNEAMENHVLLVLFNFLQHEWADLQKELKKLTEARLDYDKARNKIKRLENPDREAIEKMEKLRLTYEQQLEFLRFKLSELKGVQQTHLAALKAFVNIQTKYFTKCKIHSEETASLLEQLGTNEPKSSTT
ncbi:hypothetical protein T265_15372, partial [Opisthorchis viverrini]